MQQQFDEVLAKTNSSTKVKWRQHEMILATAITIIIGAGYVWNMYHLSPENVNSQYANVFAEKNVSFNLYRNVIFPDVAVVLSIYLTYVILNVFTISRLLSHKKFEAGTTTI